MINVRVFAPVGDRQVRNTSQLKGARLGREREGGWFRTEVEEKVADGHANYSGWCCRCMGHAVVYGSRYDKEHHEQQEGCGQEVPPVKTVNEESTACAASNGCY